MIERHFVLSSRTILLDSAIQTAGNTVIHLVPDNDCFFFLFYTYTTKVSQSYLHSDTVRFFSDFFNPLEYTKICP